MKLQFILEATGFADSKNNGFPTILKTALYKPQPNTIMRIMNFEELVNIYLGDWGEFVPMAEEADIHGNWDDDRFFKSFATRFSSAEFEDFYDSAGVIAAFDESKLVKVLGKDATIEDYVYDKKTKEYEKRIFCDLDSLPKVSKGGKYWKTITKIYIPKSTFNEVYPELLHWIGKNNLPPITIIKNY